MAAKVDGVGLDQPYLLRHPEGVPYVNGAKHLTTDGNSADDVYLQQYICYSTLLFCLCATVYGMFVNFPIDNSGVNFYISIVTSTVLQYQICFTIL